MRPAAAGPQEIATEVAVLSRIRSSRKVAGSGRTLLAAGAALLGSAALAASAQAAVVPSANDPLTGFPASYDDTVSGFKLALCQDLSGFCIETPAPNPGAALAVPGNFTPDEEGFYFLAD